MINREWHEAHKLSPQAKLDERVAWHLEHATACGCRDMPDSIKRVLAERCIPLPQQRT